MIFAYVKCANTKNTNTKYTNTAYDEVPERPNMWYIFEKRIVQGFEKLYSQVSNAQVQNTQIHKYKFYCFRIYIYIWHIWHTLLLVNCSIDKFHNLTVQAMSLRLNRLNRLNRLLHSHHRFIPIVNSDFQKKTTTMGKS